MINLSGWSNIGSFFKSTTPVVTKEFALTDLWEAFKTSSLLGAEVLLQDNVREYYLPTLSALQLEDRAYVEELPPYARPGLYEKVKELGVHSLSLGDPQDCWFAVLWRGISKIPVEHIERNLLVYYLFRAGEDGEIEVAGYLGYKVPADWTTVYVDGSLDHWKTEGWDRRLEELKNSAALFNAQLPFQNDFEFITNYNSGYNY